MSGIYDFNQDDEKVRWLKTAMQEHGQQMLARWREQDRLLIGEKAAQEKMLDLIRKAKEL